MGGPGSLSRWGLSFTLLIVSLLLILIRDSDNPPVLTLPHSFTLQLTPEHIKAMLSDLRQDALKRNVIKSPVRSGGGSLSRHTALQCLTDTMIVIRIPWETSSSLARRI